MSKFEYTFYDFPTDKIKLTPLYEETDVLEAIKADSPDAETPERIKEIYGEVYFPKAPADRPYSFSSLAISSDGKIAYEDEPLGAFIASENLRDRDGGIADWWILNMLRVYADGSIIGARTLQTDDPMVSYCYDKELFDCRVTELGKEDGTPYQYVVSFDGTDIPFDHSLFTASAVVSIATSPKGVEYCKEHCAKDYVVVGPYENADSVNEEEVKATLEGNLDKLILIGTGKDGTTDAAAFMKVIRVMGVERLLVETPSYSTHLMGQGMLDEAFWTYSSVFAGGQLALGRYESFGAADHPHSDFIKVMRHRSNYLFTRQKMIYGLKEE